MKKVYLLLLVLCQIWAFTACSDDDKEDIKKPQIPITNLSVAAEAFIGEDLNILGTGFMETTELYLKNAKEVKTKLVIKERTASGLVVTIPATLEAGTYKLVLKQGDEWELQDIKLLPAIPLKNLKIPEHVERGAVLTITGEGFVSTCKVYLKSDDGEKTELVILKHLENGTGLELQIPEDFKIGTYNLLYAVAEAEWGMDNIVVDADQRIKEVVANDLVNGTIVTYVFEYDAQNRVTSILKERSDLDTVTYVLAYSGDQLTVTKAGTAFATYTISENRVSHVAFTYYDETIAENWTYTADGYWESVPFLEQPFEIIDGNINYMWDEATPEYTYDENSQLNNFKRDVFAYMLVFIFRTYFADQIEIPFLIGCTGKPTAHLPTADGYDTYFYTTQGAYIIGVEGYSNENAEVKEVSFEFKYELAQ